MKGDGGMPDELKRLAEAREAAWDVVCLKARKQAAADGGYSRGDLRGA